MSSCLVSPSLVSIASSSDEDFDLEYMTLEPVVHSECLTTSELVEDAPNSAQMNVPREDWLKFQA